jgi:foldase protein PrsA
MSRPSSSPRRSTRTSRRASRSPTPILVKTKAEADKLHSELEGGADFAKLAKENSLDPGSKDQGGKLTISRGQTVAPFDKAAFSLKTNELSQPVKTEFGYHLIQPLAAVKAGSVTPFSEVKAQIKTQLLEERKNKAVSDWAADTEKKYDGKVTYAAGFEPPATSTGAGEETTTGE